MTIKNIQKVLQTNIRCYQQEEETISIGLGIKKNFKDFIDVLEYGSAEFMHEDILGISTSQYKKADYIHLEVLEYLKQYSLPQWNLKGYYLHPWIENISISDGDHFSYYYLFHTLPIFEPWPQTIYNGVKYNISQKDPFLIETILKLEEFYDCINAYLDNIEIDDAFLNNLQDKLLK